MNYSKMYRNINHNTTCSYNNSNRYILDRKILLEIIINLATIFVQRALEITRANNTFSISDNFLPRDNLISIIHFYRK